MSPETTHELVPFSLDHQVNHAKKTAPKFQLGLLLRDERTNMSAATKKPPAATGGRTHTEPGSSPSPTPTRSFHRHSASVSSASAIARSRSSLRNGTPVSPRTAVGSRRESLLAGSTSASSLSPASDFDDDARAALVAQLDDVKDRLSKAELASEQYRRQVDVLQSRLDDARDESAKLEEKVHEHEELIETLRNEKRDVSRQMREMEAIYEAERSAMTREKDDMTNREEEMQMVIQRLKDSLAQKASSDEEGRVSRPGAFFLPCSSFSPFFLFFPLFL